MSNLLGVLFAVLIATMAIPKIVTWQAFETDNKVMAITAQEQKTFDTAVSGYVQENAIAIQAAATATVPATITVAMLQATNFLPASFSSTNPYGQTWEAQVLEPAAGNLQVLAISKGGRTLSDTQVNSISMSVPNGGFIPQNDGGAYPTATANAIGARASWNVATAGYANITGGHLAALFNFNQGQLTSNYLYRNAVPGQPQLNQMNTPLVMAAVETSGLACTPLGAIARDTTGGLLSCPASGLWQTVGGGSWKAPVSSFAALPGASNTVGDVRLATDFNRAYAWNGAAWNALAIDQNGNMNVPGTVTMANAVITGTTTVGAACSPNGKVAQDGTGLLLSCQSGVWTSASSSSMCWKMTSTAWVYNMVMNCFGSSAANVVASSVCFGQNDMILRATSKITNGNMRYIWDYGDGTTGVYNERVVAASFSPC